jgi:acetyltransferase
MLDELRMAPVLRGARGEPPVDRAALVDGIVRFARLAVELPGLDEVEINPLIASPAGVVAVDARGRLSAGDANGNPEESRQEQEVATAGGGDRRPPSRGDAAGQDPFAPDDARA